MASHQHYNKTMLNENDVIQGPVFVFNYRESRESLFGREKVGEVS